MSNKLDKLISNINKKYGENSIMKLSEDAVNKEIDVISSGSLKLDVALGVGGFPRGRIIEIFGPESSGKTTITLHAIAEAHKKDIICAFIDMEHAYDPFYAASLGVDTEKLLFSQPDYAEQALDIVDNLASSGEVGLIVLDSIAALTPKAELDGNMGDSKVGVQARLMSQAMRKLTASISKSNVCLILINQIRMKIGVMFGNPETTTGGNAVKFYASQRLDVRQSGQKIKNKEGDIVGGPVKIKVIKNKLAPPFRIAEVNIMYGEGISKEQEVIDLSVEEGFLEKKGSWYAYSGSNLAQGKTAMQEFLKDNPEVFEELRAQLENRFFGEE